VIFLTCGRLNKPQNAFSGGHFALFIGLFVLSFTQWNLFLEDPLPNKWQLSHLLSFISLVLINFSLIVVGFWSSRSLVDDEEHRSPEKGSSIVAQLFFSWMTKPLKDGMKKDIQYEDIWELTEADDAESVLRRYDSIRYSLFKKKSEIFIGQKSIQIITKFNLVPTTVRCTLLHIELLDSVLFVQDCENLSKRRIRSI
jgi:hypothetical protein